jgi:hypothetical protein
MFASRLCTAWSLQIEASIFTMYSRASAEAGRSMDPTVGTTATDGRRSFSSSVAEELDGHSSVVNRATSRLHMTHHSNLA